MNTDKKNVDAIYRETLEEVLKDDELRYKALFESSADALMTLEPPAWSFTDGNAAALKMFGAKDKEEFTANGPWNLSPEKQSDGRSSSDKAKEMINEALHDGSHFFEWTHRRLNGEEFPATVLLTRVDLSGQTILEATVRDVTKEKIADHLIIKEKSEEVEKMNLLMKKHEIEKNELRSEIEEIRRKLQK